MSVNGNMDLNYFKAIVKNISYIYEDLFSKDDIAMIEENTFFEFEEDDEIDDLVTKGLKKNGAGDLKTTIFKKLGNETHHAFANIYSKLICCVGEGKDVKSLALEIPVYKDGKMILDKQTFSVEKAKCNMPDGNFYDDGTKAGFSADCDHLIRKYCLFLQKYDPENSLIKDLCGCSLAKKYLHSVFLEPNNAPALMSVKSAQNCGIQACQKSKWRGQGDRESCASNIAICTNNINISDNKAGGAINMEGVEVNNNCGGGNEAQIPSTNVDVQDEVEVEENNSQDDLSADSTAADSTAADSSTPAATSTDSSVPAAPATELGFFAKIMAWFSSLFGGSSEGFSPKNNKFDQMYSVFSIIVIYMLIFKDPLKIQKKVQKMF